MRRWKKRRLQSQKEKKTKMGVKNIYERFVWFDNQGNGVKSLRAVAQKPDSKSSENLSFNER